MPGTDALLVEGPWRHREVVAGGVRFHVAEHGPDDAPLVLLLHGFPECWWTWRHQLVALGDAGFRAVAPDLRGYGASDKPPRGYDAYTLSSDVAGIVRALGAEDAVLAGSDWGGFLAWTTATLHPRVVRGVVPIAMPHPLRLYDALRHDAAQLRASSYMAFFQLPRAPERWLRSGGAAGLVRRWGGPGLADPEAERFLQAAVETGTTAHCALEWYRWAFRSLTRPSGWRFLGALEAGVGQPVVQVHGTADPCLLLRTAEGSEEYARGEYELRVLDGVGHFPHLEAPDAVTAAVLAVAQR